MSDNEPSSEQTLFEFPCRFPIKVMGKANAEFEQAVLAIVRRHVADLDDDSIKRRASAKSNFLSLTVTITATSRQQLDAIYLELTACEHVKFAL